MLAALAGLHPKLIDLSLERMLRLLDALGRPHLAVPPVLHIAGTNGKGSVAAYLAAMAAAEGLAAHVYISPHLVRFNERIVLRGSPIGDAALEHLLHRTERANAGAPITFFEVTTAAAFLAFAETQADLLILETGLGGRLDATNVVPRPAATVLTAISLDHQDFLGPTLAGIAAEKAAILKPGAVAVSAPQPAEVRTVIDAAAAARGLAVAMGGRDWQAEMRDGALLWQDLHDGSRLTLPAPVLAGLHQRDNAGTAIAVARQLGRSGEVPAPVLSQASIAAGLATAHWPGRMQPVLCAALPKAEVWLDGGHNPAAGVALAATLAAMPAVGRPVWLVMGMKPNKDAAAFLAPLAGIVDGLLAVPIPDESCHAPEALVALARAQGLDNAATAADVPDALARLAVAAPHARLVICGSLYLVGAVLAAPLVAPILASSAVAAR